MNKFEEVMNAIMDNNLQAPVLKHLQDWLIDESMRALNQSRLLKADINAIKNINRGKNKDIALLCEDWED